MPIWAWSSSVHAPEFEFGKRAENIDRGIRDHGLTYPVALDNDFTFWRALGNNAWPAKYLIEGEGRLVDQWVGEGGYERVESDPAASRCQAPGTELPPVSPEAMTFATIGEPSYVGVTAETYVGTDQRVPGTFALVGDWRSNGEYVELASGTARSPFPSTPAR